MKICIKCKKEKELSFFYYRKDSSTYRNECKDCYGVLVRNRRKPEETKKYFKLYYIKNKTKKRAQNRQWKLKNKERAYELNKKSFIKTKLERSKKHKERYKNDISYKLRFTCRHFIRRCILNKKDRTSKVLGYTSEMLKKRIECQFKPGMSWENYGVYKKNGPLTWNIDHKKPIDKFEDKTNIKLINMLSNLQPMWSLDNLIKSNN